MVAQRQGRWNKERREADDTEEFVQQVLMMDMMDLLHVNTFHVSCVSMRIGVGFCCTFIDGWIDMRLTGGSTRINWESE